MKSVGIKIISGIVLGLIGLFLVNLSTNSTSEETIQKYEGLCKNIAKTVAYYDSTYSVLKVSVAKVATIKFKYVVNNNFYNGEQVVPASEAPTDPVVEIWYDSQNPASYSIEEPCAQLDLYKKKHKLPSNWLFFGGALFVLIGISRVYSALIHFLRGVFMPGKGGKTNSN